MKKKRKKANRWFFGNKKVTPDSIRKLGTKLGVEFPESCVKIVSAHNGGSSNEHPGEITLAVVDDAAEIVGEAAEHQTIEVAGSSLVAPFLLRFLAF